MPAYSRGDLSVEAYLVRIIAALCRQNGGELRVKGELVDTVGEATALLKAWDPTKQELVLTTAMGTFGEVFRVVPEKQAGAQTVITQKPADPLTKLFQDGSEPEKEPRRATSTLDNPEKLKELESRLLKRRVASMLQDELNRRRTAPPNQGD